MAGILWFITLFPFSFMQKNFVTYGLAQKLATSLFCNSAIGMSLMFVMQREGAKTGLQWSNMFTPITPDEAFSVGGVMLMLIFDICLYGIITFYVEKVFPGDYGVPERWDFIFQESFWSKDVNDNDFDIDIENHLMEENLTTDTEPVPEELNVGIELRRLRKAYDDENVAVKGLTMKMFENQITVLLGRNGAGKTTTFNMLAGITLPTSGTAKINGFDIQRDREKAQSSLGLCPQQNILFDALTVTEHIKFYSKLKGIPENKLEEEVSRYCQFLNLNPNQQAKTLSGGMQRKLSFGIALCGGAKVIICDEPTSGVDPASRRELWDLLLKAREGRTILLSTHFMDEADILGDRIAILNEGELKSVGSPFYLKKKYGGGYRLVCVKRKYCCISDVTTFLSKYISDIELQHDVGTELCFKLPATSSSIFKELLTDLEGNMMDLGIESYGVANASLQEVFMRCV